MTAASAAAGGSIHAAPSSTLSPHAAPFTLPARQACAPPGRLQDGDASRLVDDNFVLNGEDKKSYSTSPAARFGMTLRDTVYPVGTHGILESQPSTSCGIHVYPSSTSSISGIVAEPSVMMASDLKQHQIPLISGKGRNGNKYPAVTIRNPPNKTSETNNISFGSYGKLAIRQNDESNKKTGKGTSFHENLDFSNDANGNGTSQGTMVVSKALNPEFSVKPLHIPSTCASSCVTMAGDVNPDPSECSVDSPCWRGTSASRLSSFDVLQASASQSIKQESEAFDSGQEQSSSTVQHCEAPAELQSLVASMSKQNHSQAHAELDLSRRPGEIDINLIKDSQGMELELVKQGAEKCNAEQKHYLEVIDDRMKRSGLNSAAPDFIPLSVRKSNMGCCSSTGGNISGILKAMESMSEVLWNNYSDEIGLEEHDHNRLQSVIENLQSFHHKARKVPIKGASDKAGLKARHSQNAVSKSVTGNNNGSYTADNGKGIIISNVADSSHLLGDFGKNSMTGYQEFTCEEEHSQALIYKNLWIDAERANCALKYQLKQTRMEIDLESSMAHIGGGPRNPSFQLHGMGNGSAITCPTMLKDHPEARKSQNLLYVGDRIQSGDNSVLSRSKGYITAPKNIHGERFLSGSEEPSIRCHPHRGLQLAPNRAHRGLNLSTSDGVSSLLHITGRDGSLLGSCEFRSSDWEHVLKEEIDSS